MAELGDVNQGFGLGIGVARLCVGQGEKHDQRAAANPVGVAEVTDDRGSHRKRLAFHLPLEQIHEPDVRVCVLLLEVVG